MNGASKTVTIAAWAAVGTTALVFFSLAALHGLSPEFDPSWRMVSEYANGQHGWLLAVMFTVWALSSWSLAVALWPWVKTLWGRIGWGFLLAAGVGEALAAVFDIRKELHSLAALIGIGSLPVAALLISPSLIRAAKENGIKSPLAWSAHLPWASVVLMALSFAVLMTTFVQAGGDTTSTAPVTVLPPGVIAVVGWANRLLIVAYGVWVLTAAGLVLRLRKQSA